MSIEEEFAARDSSCARLLKYYEAMENFSKADVYEVFDFAFKSGWGARQHYMERQQ